MILNEPEASLHPSLLALLARLLRQASAQCRIVFVSHSRELIATIDRDSAVTLGKSLGETFVDGETPTEWVWPSR